MKHIKSVISILLLTSMLTGTLSVLPQAKADGIAPYYGMLDEIGTHFELQNFNITVTTSITVHILLYACSPEMISYYIETTSDEISTQVTIGYFNPLTTYFIYQDSLVNESPFTTDDTGVYTYIQDLSYRHHVFIQPRSSTIIIRTSTTLQSDIYDDVVIAADNVVLDLNGHSIIGPNIWWYWIGLDVTGFGPYRPRQNVTIQNGCIRNFGVAIYLGDCSYITIRNMTICSNLWSAVEMSGVWNSLFVENSFVSGTALECGWHSSGNRIYHNSFVNSHCWAEAGYPNSWDDGYPSGGNYWSSYTGIDLYHGENQDIPGSDGMGDTEYMICANNIDNYPLMSPWTPTETVVKIGKIDEPVTIVTNTAINQITATKNTLALKVEGQTGETGYVNLIFPMVNTTSIKVKIDGQEPASPFPSISTNGTHYFIYFEFTLSTHTVTIQFGPAVIVDIDPDTLNLKNDGNWITAYLEIAEKYSANDICLPTITLNDTVAVELAPTEIGDHDHDGIPDLMVKFNRTEVSHYILDVQGITNGNVTLTITGELSNGAVFEGSDTIRVRMPGDANCDGKVDMKDVGTETKEYGSSTQSLDNDLNEDGVIDIKDIGTVCKNVGNKY